MGSKSTITTSSATCIGRPAVPVVFPAWRFVNSMYGDFIKNKISPCKKETPAISSVRGQALVCSVPQYSTLGSPRYAQLRPLCLSKLFQSQAPCCKLFIFCKYLHRNQPSWASVSVWTPQFGHANSSTRGTLYLERCIIYWCFARSIPSPTQTTQEVAPATLPLQLSFYLLWNTSIKQETFCIYQAFSARDYWQPTSSTFSCRGLNARLCPQNCPRCAADQEHLVPDVPLRCEMLLLGPSCDHPGPRCKGWASGERPYIPQPFALCRHCTSAPLVQTGWCQYLCAQRGFSPTEKGK